MNRYEVRISGNLHPVNVRASNAAVALQRALRGFTDSQFLNTAITIQFRGKVPRVYKVRGAVLGEDGTRRVKTLASNLPSYQAAKSEMEKLRTRPDVSYLHIGSNEETV
jgi:hypothetical protein